MPLPCMFSAKINPILSGKRKASYLYYHFNICIKPKTLNCVRSNFYLKLFETNYYSTTSYCNPVVIQLYSSPIATV